MAAAALDDAVVWPEDAVEVGRIVDAWGIKGGFKVQPFSGDPQALFSSRRWFLRPPDGRPGPKPAVVPPPVLRVGSAREQGDVIVATAHEIADRNAAEALRGCRVFVSRGSFPSTGDGEYYWVDLIGLDVVNRDGVALGRVADLLDTGAHSVLRVLAEPAEAPAAPVERLIPFVAAYIDAVELDRRRITVDWGLDY
mgnify:CR=1 FL=1